MKARLAALLILLLANWLVWRSVASAVTFDNAGLRTALLAAHPHLQEERFADSALLPADYLFLRAAEVRGLCSVYAGFYPSLGLALAEPHDPPFCYATQGWSVGATGSLEVTVGEHPVTVATVSVQMGAERRFVVYWAQARGEYPVDPGDTGLGQELLTRWRTGRSDLVWVRLEWQPEAAARTGEADFQAVVGSIVARVREAVRRAD